MPRMSEREIKIMITQTKRVLVAAKKFEKLGLEEEPFEVTLKEEEAEEMEGPLGGAEVMVEVAAMGKVVVAVELGENPKQGSQTIGPTLTRATIQQELRDRSLN